MIGERLKELRINHNYTQRDIGNYLNMSHVSYGDYERNRSYPDVDTLKKLCKLYKISIDYLLSDNLNNVLIIPKSEYENLKNAIKNINLILENIDKNVLNNQEKEEDSNIQNSFNHFNNNGHINIGNGSINVNSKDDKK